ncbi:MAG TPA: MBL fold metallo-hydrolase [Anaerolineaceae bacterium]|nr:MBL fold metallo-hydrolase [Anaerolineaceae bacterium]HQH86158.1 MBL fold metallo-hydrolase [Anaerolineaceae bacterium]
MNKWITKNGIQIDQILSGRSNAFLVSFDHKYILIDTGTQDSWYRLKKRLNSVIPENSSLAALILTHVHFDHCENSSRIKDDYGANIIVHESEALLLSSGKNSFCQGALPVTRRFFNLINGRKLFSLVRCTPCAYDAIVTEEYQLNDLGFNAYILHTPGHTIGSMSMIVDNEIAIVGDAMFGVFPNSVFPPWADDTTMLTKSWKKLLDTGCALFLPGHGTSNSRDLVQRQYTKYGEKVS